MNTRTSVFLTAALSLALTGCGRDRREQPSPNPAAAWTPESSAGAKDDPDFAAAIEAHLRGVDGDDDAAARALASFKALSERHPEHALVRAYLGSARVLASRRMVLPWNKGKEGKAGLALLDEAVALAPDDLEVRYVRALSTYPLPDFFERREHCARDLEWLAERAESAVEHGALTRRQAAKAFLRHGEIRASIPDLAAARDAWKHAERLCPEEEPGREARERLEEIGRGKELEK